MLQHIVKFTLPKGTDVYPIDFRKAVAKELDDMSQDELFNYKNGNGRDSYPYGRFVGGRGWVGYVSEAGEALSTSVLSPGIKVLSKLGINAGVTLSQEQKRCYLSDDPIIYSISGGVDKSKNKRLRNRTDAQYIEHMIWRMLEQAVKLNLMDILPTEDDLGLKVFETRSLGIPASHNNNEGGLFYTKVSGTFTMNLTLEGLWQAGQLLSRGHGLIYRQNKGGHYKC